MDSRDSEGSGAVAGRPVLELGGTHARACRIDPATWQVLPGSVSRLPLDSSGSADAIVATTAACADALGLMPAETLAVAIPGPFDYRTGVALYEGVGKFESLAGINLRQALLARLAHPPGRMTFVNDAEAFGLGEWLAGSARGYQRVVAITLGTGVGSAFVEGGTVVSTGPTVPPDGHVYELAIGGRPLEETVSRRAILAAYRDLAPSSGTSSQDVREIAAVALAGDRTAAGIFGHAFRLLGEALAPWLLRFRAQILVVGGGLSASWTLVYEPLRIGLGDAAGGLVVVRSASTEDASAAGAAWHSNRALASAEQGLAAGL